MKDNIIVVEKENCYGCHACSNICPTGAITMSTDEEGFYYPVVNDKLCVNCKKCLDVCPHIHPPKKKILKKAFACYAKNEEEHLSSSSGGFFSVIARKCIKDNGVVFGAAFDDNLEVHHIKVSSLEDIHKLKGTKYIQSKLGDIFIDVRNELHTGKKVVFSGTPCQIVALKNFLGGEYENLICIDLICHGVPSPLVWKRYLNENFGEDNVVMMQFRNKEKGIQNLTLDYTLKDNQIIHENYRDSLYIKGFIHNLYTRPSCFNCNFKGDKRSSDITIGDFWSIQEFHPEMNHKFGVSAVIIHTVKGEDWLKSISNELNICKSTSSKIAVWNESLFKAAILNKDRIDFFDRWEENSINDTILSIINKRNDKTNTTMEKKHFFETILNRFKRIMLFIRK